ncbi:hypothetical protein [Bacteriovorax sp. Seq25_V]|uniref:hypothetical protein n=1 Tax=Bacteriovorax sp. Seq25_V TaxID=1201288 RepID=UPI00038A0DD8|nr:hypothetical protein [Bacteriovorax sp. Seq25_V]EQC45335.1 hypothetical protein M900_2034 [Bacteriovorax sp. Seq25_V]
MIRLIAALIIAFQTLAISYGECVAIPSSKVYINPDFTQPFPKTISFACKYECQADTLEVINATSTIKVNNFDEEARNLVCQGVIVKKSKWGYEMDSVEPFFIYATRLSEIKDFGHGREIPVDIDASASLREKLNTDFKLISSAYITAGKNSPEFLEAGLLLESMIDNLPLLDEYLSKFSAADYKVPPGLSSEGLLYNVLISSAFWRI